MNPRKRKEGESEDSSEAKSASKKRRQKGSMEERFEKRSWSGSDRRTNRAKRLSFYGAKGRLDHSKFFVDKDGKRHPVKTSFATRGEHLLTPNSKQKARQKNAEAHEGIVPTFRSIRSPAPSPSKPSIKPTTDSPLKVMETPDGKTPMYLQGIHGRDAAGLGLYSNIPPRTVDDPKSRKNLSSALGIEQTPEELAKIAALEKENEVKKLAALNRVVKPQGPSKTNSMLVTNRQMQEVSKELDLNSGKRSVPGGKVMAAAPDVSRVSANDYAENLDDIGLFISEFDGKKTKRRFEWVHGGISHEVGGKKTQKPEMFTCDTFEMNNWYILGENNHRYLAKKFPQGFMISSHVPLMQKMIAGKLEYTHIPDGLIKIKITTNTGFEYDSSLDTEFRDNNPRIEFVTYVLSKLKEKVEKWEAEQEAQNSLKPRL